MRVVPASKNPRETKKPKTGKKAVLPFSFSRTKNPQTNKIKKQINPKR